MSMPSRRTTVDAEKGIDDIELKQQSSKDDDTISKRAEVSPDSETYPLGVKLSAYRLWTFCFFSLFGVPKVLEGWRNGVISWTRFNAIVAVLLAIWVFGLRYFERRQPPIVKWFFHDDYTPELYYIPLYFVFCGLTPTVLWFIFVGLTMVFWWIYQYLFTIDLELLSVSQILLTLAYWIVSFVLVGLGMVGVMFRALPVASRCHAFLMPIPIYKRAYNSVAHWGREIVKKANDRFEKHPLLYISTAISSLAMPFLAWMAVLELWD